MQTLIRGYEYSCKLAKSRIEQLTTQKKTLEKQGNYDLIGRLDLDRRITLLRTEYGQMQEIIAHLSSYARRREIVET